MATYHEELQKGGALLHALGLQPSSKGWSIVTFLQRCVHWTVSAG
jgi:hypothetical protein